MKNLMFLFALLISLSSFSQTDTIAYIIHNGKYHVDNGFYSFKELKPKFDSFPDTRKYYKDKYESKEVAGGLLFAAGGLSIVAIAFLEDQETEGCYDALCDLDLRPALLTFIGASFLGGGLAVNLTKNSATREDLVRMYNAHFREDLGYQNYKPELKLVFNENGLGLSYKF